MGVMAKATNIMASLVEHSFPTTNTINIASLEAAPTSPK